MSINIGGIENTWLRRLVIVVTFPINMVSVTLWAWKLLYREAAQCAKRRPQS